MEKIEEITTGYRVELLLVVIANLIPLIGYIFLEWGMFELLFLIWFEGGVLALLATARISIATESLITRIFMMILFPVCYLGSMSVFGFFIFRMYDIDVRSTFLGVWPALINYLSNAYSVWLPIIFIIIYGIVDCYKLWKPEKPVNIAKTLESTWGSIFIIVLAILMAMLWVGLLKEKEQASLFVFVLVVIFKLVIDFIKIKIRQRASSVRNNEIFYH